MNSQARRVIGEVKGILETVRVYQTNMELVRDAAYSLDTVGLNFQKNERLKKKINEAIEKLQEVTYLLANEFSSTNFKND